MAFVEAQDARGDEDIGAERIKIGMLGDAEWGVGSPLVEKRGSRRDRIA